MSKYNLIKNEPKIDIETLKDTNLTLLQKIILCNRINTEIVNKYNYNINDLYNSKFDPIKNINLLPDISEAGKIISKYIKNNKHILLVSDMDTDGITSAAVLHISFRDILKVNKNNFKSIVNKRRNGNGFNKELINRIKQIHQEWNIDMIITADHGSSDESAFKELKEYGISKIILTDHHTIPINNYPKSVDIVINPHREDSKYYKDVSGCFIAFITMLSTMKYLKGKYHLHKFEKVFSYIALSTISDVMNLSLPINRQIVKYGLVVINSLQEPTWIAIRNILGIKNRIDSTDLGFKIAPLINTANRVDKEELAFKLMVETDLELANHYAKLLTDYSMKRKKVQKSLLNHAEEQLKTLKYDNSIVLSLNSEYAINGMIASSIGEKYNKPSICFLNTENPNILTGSGRGINSNVNLINIFNNINSKHPDILIKYGGHKLAAGCKIYKNKLDKFREIFDKEIKTIVSSEPITENNIYYDLELKSNDITPIIFMEQERMLPFGNKWEKPVYLSKLKIGSILIMGNILAKIKLITSDETELDGIYFFNKDNSEYTPNNIKKILRYGDKVNVVYSLNMNSFNDVISFELEIKNIIKDD